MRHALAIVLVGLAGPALAHSALLRTSLAGSAVGWPSQVCLEFSGANGKRVPTGRAEAQGKRARGAAV